MLMLRFPEHLNGIQLSALASRHRCLGRQAENHHSRHTITTCMLGHVFAQAQIGLLRTVAHLLQTQTPLTSQQEAVGGTYLNEASLGVDDLDEGALEQLVAVEGKVVDKPGDAGGHDAAAEVAQQHRQVAPVEGLRLAACTHG